MKFKKIGFVSSNKPEAIKALKSLKRLYENVPPNEADVIVALGGDGTVLKSLHDFLKNKIPIYGMNRGFVGFLMNQFAEKNLLKRLSEAIPYKLYPLIIKSYDKKGNIQNGLAFNDVSMIRNSPRIAKIKVQVNNKIRINEFLGDGCLISTPAGSSAYNLSLRGPVIPVGAQVLALTPISPYRPRRWRGALLNNDVKITLHSLDHESRPVRAEADFMEFDDLVKLEIELDKTKFMNLLFDPGHDMEERIITEQFDN
jgi:NAD+ kinase|tara:strand:- start:636 stop:1403 length:768 start_codon:yes stop_codon:yes gene_type:complete